VCLRQDLQQHCTHNSTVPTTALYPQQLCFTPADEDFVYGGSKHYCSNAPHVINVFSFSKVRLLYSSIHFMDEQELHTSYLLLIQPHKVPQTKPDYNLNAIQRLCRGSARTPQRALMVLRACRLMEPWAGESVTLPTPPLEGRSWAWSF